MNRIAKGEMIKISQEEYLGQIVGGFIVRDDEWILSNTVEKFKRYIESKGFEVAECKETKTLSMISGRFQFRMRSSTNRDR